MIAIMSKTRLCCNARADLVPFFLGEQTVRPLSTVLAVFVTAGSFSAAIAQHHHSPGAPHLPGSPAKQVTDGRELVKFPPALVDHTLSNMRDHLQALQEIQSHLGMGHADVAARIAESRLGMSSLSLHGAQHVAKYMPKGMQNAGTTMHQAASRFAITAQDASVTGDLKPVFAGLAEITGACVSCHAGYRLK